MLTNKSLNELIMAQDKEKDYSTIKIQSKHIILISDIHFGWNSASEEWLNNISDYFENWFIPLVESKLKENPDCVLFCLGDVYHDRMSIDIDANELCISTFETLSKMLPVYIINGNHDLSKKTNKGTSSLRSLDNISNLTLIREPTLVKCMDGKKCFKNIAAIPYLGDCNEENKQIVKFSGTADYAFMHTDISKMKFNNGKVIVGAVDAEKFNGKIISGHIHKMQETPKVTYIGSPYQMSRSDIGNVSGIFTLNLETGFMDFTENKYSPIFQKIELSSLVNYDDSVKHKMLANNYTDIIVEEDDIDKKYKRSDIYKLIDIPNAKKVIIEVVPSKSEINLSDEEDYEKLSIEDLINKSIDELSDVDEETKGILKSISSEYYKTALAEFDAN